MKIYGQEIIAKWTQDPARRMDVFHAALYYPKFAEDADIRRVIEDCTLDPSMGIRAAACKILALAGHPEAIKWLTYCALSQHPIYGWNQTHWEERITSRNALLEFAGQLSEHCIELLVNDMCRDGGNSHFQVLSAAPKSLVVPRLKMLMPLPHADVLWVQLAYILVSHGDYEYRTVLEQFAKTGRYFEIAVVALSCLQDERAVEVLQEIMASKAARFFEKFRQYYKNKDVEIEQRKLRHFQFWLEFAQSSEDEDLIKLPD